MKVHVITITIIILIYILTITVFRVCVNPEFMSEYEYRSNSSAIDGSLEHIYHPPLFITEDRYRLFYSEKYSIELPEVDSSKHNLLITFNRKLKEMHYNRLSYNKHLDYYFGGYKHAKTYVKDRLFVYKIDKVVIK